MDLIASLHARCWRCLHPRRAIWLLDGKPACDEHKRQAVDVRELAVLPDAVRAAAGRVAAEWARG